MKRQSYNAYILSRVEYSVAVGLFMEFDYEMPLVSDFPEPRSENELKELKRKTLKFEFAEPEELHRKGEISFPCMKYAGILKKNPADIAKQLKPYLDWFEWIDRVEIVGGYLNIFYNRTKFFLSIGDICHTQ